MVYVFALMISTYPAGIPLPDKTSYWYSIERCNYFAGKLQKHRFLYGGSRKIQAHCIPEWVNPKTTKILR